MARRIPLSLASARACTVSTVVRYGNQGIDAWRARAGGENGRRPRPAVVAMLLVAAVAGVVLLHGRSSTASAPPATTCPALGPGPRADIDGDGCDDALHFDAGVLDAAGVRARLGQPGDVVAAGRWTCGPATLALLRPRT